MNKKTRILFIILMFLVVASVLTTYYRSFVKHDYTVEGLEEITEE